MKPSDGNKRAVGREIHNTNQLRAFANAEARRERDAARARKKAAKGGTHDVFDSNARRAHQAQKDAVERARPVASLFSGGAGVLRLRALGWEVFEKVFEVGEDGNATLKHVEPVALDRLVVDGDGKPTHLRAAGEGDITELDAEKFVVQPVLRTGAGHAEVTT
jgi:hypothetical protein